MTSLAVGLDYIDLNFLGLPQIIATAVIQDASGVALLDPGPSTTLEQLRSALQRKGISMSDVRQVLLTHIHLDHAGVVGTLVRENPAIEVLVHERGAPHMIDPAKLLASAGRLYGADMERLWGEFLPVPANRVRELKGGERISVCGRELEVAYTPGHASHHVSYFDQASRIAFFGDIDLDIWRVSEARILAWDPDTLFLTHFGPFHGARPQFQALMDRLGAWSRIVRRLLANQEMDDAQRQQAFVDEALRDLRRSVGDHEAEHYSRAGRLDYSWQGLSRYWRRKKG